MKWNNNKSLLNFNFQTEHRSRYETNGIQNKFISTYFSIYLALTSKRKENIKNLTPPIPPQIIKTQQQQRQQQKKIKLKLKKTHTHTQNKTLNIANKANNQTQN